MGRYTPTPIGSLPRPGGFGPHCPGVPWGMITDHEVPEEMLRQIARGEIPCPYCRGTKVYEHVEVDSRSISIFDPCPYCDPDSPRNKIPRLEEQVADLRSEVEDLRQALLERPRCPRCGDPIRWEGGDLVCDQDEDCGWTASSYWGDGG